MRSHVAARAIDPQCRSDLTSLAPRAWPRDAELPEPSLKQTLSRFRKYSYFNGERNFACLIKSRELLRDAIYPKLAGLKALAKLAHAQGLWRLQPVRHAYRGSRRRNNSHRARSARS